MSTPRRSGGYLVPRNLEWDFESPVYAGPSVPNNSPVYGTPVLNLMMRLGEEEDSQLRLSPVEIEGVCALSESEEEEEKIYTEL